MHTPGRLIGAIVLTAVVYALLARMGLLLDPVGGFASVVWAPTGVAIAAVFFAGYRLGAGVLLGAFAANLLSGAPAVVAAVIATGNTLEAIVAVALLRRVRAFDARLRRVNDVLLFIALAVMTAPVVSATVGVLALRVSGIVPASEAGDAWRAWWVGDAIGALIIAPLILVWRQHGVKDLSGRLMEGLALIAALIVVSALVFLDRSSRESTAFLQAYLVFPLLIWAAMRFTQRGAVTAILVMCVIAVWGTAAGAGPFVQPRLRDSLFALQSFMGVTAICFLIVATAMAEREHALISVASSLAEVDEANRAKSDFLATMSHELRTPLNAIAGYAQLLSMHVHGPLTAEQREFIQRIETNQRHLTSLVEDVLSFTRVEGGRLALHASSVDAAGALRALPPFVESQARSKEIALVLKPVPPALAVRADPDRLRQILLNLVINAIKYTSAGGRVEVECAAVGETVHFIIRDTGMGIPPALLKRVFEPFFQVDHGHTRKSSGVGLGLTISRDLARAMGGDVLIASEPGRGTVATLVLPAFPNAG